MLVPEVIHSEEHESSATVDNVGSTHTGSGSDGIGSSKIVGGSETSGTSRTSNSNARSGGIRGGSGAQTYNKSPASTTENPYDGSGNESNEYGPELGSGPQNINYPYNNLDYEYHNVDDIINYEGSDGLFPKKEKTEPDPQIDDDPSKQAALIVSIVASILIVIIIIILIVLKCNSRSRETIKIEEAKAYSSLSQGPTMIVNGQNSSAVKPNDRRPVKKERKDVKEWYVW